MSEIKKVSIPFESFNDAKNHSFEVGNFVTDNFNKNYSVMKIEDEIIEIDGTYNVIVHIEKKEVN